MSWAWLQRKQAATPSAPYEGSVTLSGPGVFQVYGLLKEILSVGREIRTGQEKLLLDLTGIKDQFTQLEGGLAALQSAQTLTTTALAALQASVQSEFAAITKTLADFGAQIASGAGITQADIDALTARATTANTNIAVAIEAVQTANGSVAAEQAALDGESATVTAADPGAPAAPTTAPAAPAAAPAAQGPLHGVSG
jgi:hypothetical protein